MGHKHFDRDIDARDNLKGGSVDIARLQGTLTDREKR